MGFVRPGDSILEISGQQVTQKQQFYPPFASETVTLKLVPSNSYSLPMVRNFFKLFKFLINYLNN